MKTSEYVGGYVAVDDGKILSIESTVPLKFTVVQEKNPNIVMLVESPRTVPENFKIDVPVSLQGTFDRSKNLFTAEVIKTQCPSKYEASKKEGGAMPVYPTGFPTAAPPPAPVGSSPAGPSSAVPSPAAPQPAKA